VGDAPAWASLDVVINHAPSSVVRWGVGFEISHHILRGVTGFAQVCSIYSQNYHPVTGTWESFPIASHLSFCTKGIHARSCRIHHWCEWILRLRPAVARRMTESPEVPSFIWQWRESSVLFLWSSLYSPDFNCLWAALRECREVCYHTFPIIFCSCSLDLPR